MRILITILLIVTVTLSCNTSKKIDLAVAFAMDKCLCLKGIVKETPSDPQHGRLRWYNDLIPKFPLYELDTLSHISIDTTSFAQLGDWVTKEVDSIGVFIWSKPSDTMLFIPKPSAYKYSPERKF